MLIVTSMKMKKLLLFLMFLASLYSFAQIRGTVADQKGNAMSFVNIYVQDTYISTTTNEQGKFELNIKTPGKYIILFQYLGYKTEKKIINADKFPQIVVVVMVEEEIKLNEVIIDPKVNPANEMIRNAIANRKINSNKTARYKADFYSKGIFRVKNLPKNILGQKLDLFDDVIDSTRSGILYLSETLSKISFQKPDKMKETIVASKVSGNDNGFSFNNAASANFDFYENTVEFNEKAISPIADNAFNYYRYKFEGSFTDENNQLINKIKVTPKRKNEPVLEGHIYLVDDSWAIYAIDLTITGVQMQTPALNTLTLKQNFSYNNSNKIWIKNTQTIDFEAGIMTLKMNGRFTYVFSNFEFPEKFEKKTFGAEVLRFEENANKKEDAFWNDIRPVPLTTEETNDYLKKDALQAKKKSKVYLDSIDIKKNKLSWMSPISGYTYTNSFKKWMFNYDGPLLKTTFNTVQGWTTSIGFSYTKTDEDRRINARINTQLNYGFAEDKLRGTTSYFKKFNNKNYSSLFVSGGSTVNQFNANQPISKIVNSVSSLFFVNNYMKLYEKNYVSFNFGREVINGLNMNIGLDYSERKPLWNTSDQRWIKSEDDYTSNHPKLPFDFENAAIDKHNLVKGSLNAQIKFGQEYWTRPDGKFNLGNNKYPSIFLGYEKGFAATNKNYEFDFVSARVTHDLSVGNKGQLQMNLKVGKFFNGENISFVDYKHFNGNQTHIANGGSYLNVFNNLPYYSMSTNDSYFETHFEHNDKGYIMNKIPLLNKLQSQLMLGFHNLSIPNQKPYQEFSIGLDNLGFGKLRLFRVDYVRSYQNGYQGDAVVFGLKFLNLIE
jgi:hypothetical protein